MIHSVWYIALALSPGWWQTGIRQESGGQLSLVTCNQIFDAGGAFMFGLDNTFTIWAKNDMTANIWGLYVNWGLIGPQGINQSHDNRWLGTTWGSSNPHTHAEYSNGNLSPLLVQPGAPWEPIWNSAFGIPPIPVPVTNTGTGWNGPNCPVVNNIVDLDSLFPLNERKNYMVSLLTNADTLWSEKDSTLLWSMLFNVFRILRTDSVLLASDTRLQVFHDSCAMATCGLIESGLRLASDTIDTKPEALKEKADSLLAVNSSYIAELTMTHAVGMKLLLAADGLLNYTHQAWVHQLANECPYEKGPSVHVARSMVLDMDGYANWTVNDCEKVPPPPSERQGPKDETDYFEVDGYNVNVNIYPNPVVNKAVTLNIIDCSTQDRMVYHYSIYNSVGQRMLTGIATCGLNPINMTGINSGLLLIRVTDSSGRTIDESKIVVP